MFGDLLHSVGGAAVEVLKTSAVPLIAGAVIKHGKAIPGIRAAAKRIPNDMIPLVTATAGTIATGNLDAGVMSAAAASFVHQATKIGARAVLERVAGTKSLGLERKIGPGDRLSL